MKIFPNCFFRKLYLFSVLFKNRVCCAVCRSWSYSYTFIFMISDIFQLSIFLFCFFSFYDESTYKRNINISCHTHGPLDNEMIYLPICYYFIKKLNIVILSGTMLHGALWTYLASKFLEKLVVFRFEFRASNLM